MKIAPRNADRALAWLTFLVLPVALFAPLAALVCGAVSMPAYIPLAVSAGMAWVVPMVILLVMPERA